MIKNVEELWLSTLPRRQVGQKSKVSDDSGSDTEMDGNLAERKTSQAVMASEQQNTNLAKPMEAHWTSPDVDSWAKVRGGLDEEEVARFTKDDVDGQTLAEFDQGMFADMGFDSDTALRLFNQKEADKNGVVGWLSTLPGRQLGQKSKRVETEMGDDP